VARPRTWPAGQHSEPARHRRTGEDCAAARCCRTSPVRLRQPKSRLSACLAGRVRLRDCADEHLPEQDNGAEAGCQKVTASASARHWSQTALGAYHSPLQSSRSTGRAAYMRCRRVARRMAHLLHLLPAVCGPSLGRHRAVRGYCRHHGGWLSGQSHLGELMPRKNSGPCKCKLQGLGVG